MPNRFLPLNQNIPELHQQQERLKTPTGEARCPLTRPCQQKRSPQRHFTRRGQNLAAAGTSPGTAIAHTCTRRSI